jgi:D-sedoheptulose 7-phosphate isomerase
MKNWLDNYISAQHRALDSVPVDAIERLITTVREAWLAGRNIFVIGNGGNAANASHFATDLGKGASDAVKRRFRVLSLCDNSAWITALGNDYSYEDIFVRQLENFAAAGDVLLAGSVSGNSPNVVKAFSWARDRGLHTIALVGAKRGRLADLAGQTIVIADTHYGRVEDVQMHMLHMVAYAFIEAAPAAGSPNNAATRS